MGRGIVDNQEIDDLIDKLESDDVQTQLLPGFQRFFGASISAKWRKNHYLSEREQEILSDIVQRYDASHRSGSFSRRRYEGYQK